MLNMVSASLCRWTPRPSDLAPRHHTHPPSSTSHTHPHPKTSPLQNDQLSSTHLSVPWNGGIATQGHRIRFTPKISDNPLTQP